MALARETLDKIAQARVSLTDAQQRAMDLRAYIDEAVGRALDSVGERAEGRTSAALGAVQQAIGEMVRILDEAQRETMRLLTEQVEAIREDVRELLAEEQDDEGDEAPDDGALDEVLERIRALPTRQDLAKLTTPSAPRRWEFHVGRDSRGRIAEVTAEAEDDLA